jgi:hypothetical protein
MWKLNRKPIFYINITFIYLLITKFLFPTSIYAWDIGISFFSGYFLLGLVYFIFIWIPIAYLLTSIFIILSGNTFHFLKGKHQLLKTIISISVFLLLITIVTFHYVRPNESYIYVVANVTSLPIFTVFIMNAYENK